MQDIDNFSEAKMSKSNLEYFANLLPEPLQSKFNDVSKGHSIDVLQGYRGPTHLRNGESGDSATEEEYFGVQRIGFWFAMSKHWNWFPALGSIVFGITRLTQSIEHTSDWTYLYFDTATGEIKDSEEAIKAQLKNKRAEEHFTRSEKLMQSREFEEAFNEAKIALDMCSDGYKNQKSFKKTMDMAQAQRATQLYKEADHLGHDNQLEEALELFKKAYKLSVDSTEQLNISGRINDTIALIYAKEGETLFNDGNYQKAKEKFELASGKTKQTIYKESFNNWLQRIKTELEAADIKEEGDLLFNSQKYNESIVHYRLALRTTQIDSEKMKIRRLIQVAEQKFPAHVTRDASQEQAQKKAKALDMVNKGVELMCEGNILRMDRQFSAAVVKYDKASQNFQQAAQINPLNIIFNFLLKLIDAYNEIQGYDKAKQLIDKAKDIFPDKSEEFEDIKRKIGTMDWSPDYLKMFVTQEDNSNEPQASMSQSYPF